MKIFYYAYFGYCDIKSHKKAGRPIRSTVHPIQDGKRNCFNVIFIVYGLRIVLITQVYLQVEIGLDV